MRRALTRLRRALVGDPLVLPAALLGRFPELGEARWRRGGLPPRVGGWCLGRLTVGGIAVGRTVFLAPGAPLRPAFLLHEVAHVRQFAAERGFVVRYWWESLRVGYRRNRYEREADAFAAARLVPTLPDSNPVVADAASAGAGAGDALRARGT